MVQPGLIILGLSIAFLLVSLCIPQWDVGYLYKASDATRQCVAYILIAGTACIVAAWIIELLFLCISENNVLSWIIRILLFVGSILVITACVIYNFKAVNEWSFFCALFGSVIALMMGVFGLLSGGEK